MHADRAQDTSLFRSRRPIQAALRWHDTRSSVVPRPATTPLYRIPIIPTMPRPTIAVCANVNHHSTNFNDRDDPSINASGEAASAVVIVDPYVVRQLRFRVSAMDELFVTSTTSLHPIDVIHLLTSMSVSPPST
jgi:hypothetical protein